MELKMLDWDSVFFGKRIYALHLGKDEDIIDAEIQIQKVNADLVYIFIPVDSDIRTTLDNRSEIIMYDHKLTYKMLLNGQKFNISNDIEEVNYDPGKDFISLAISSGIFSRFSLDPKLNYRFEEMYELWLRNSLNRNIADKVFVSKEDGFIKSFITCKIRNGVGTIGLIATHKEYRGKSLGRHLIDRAHHWYQYNNVNYSEVVTQKANTIACAFYEKYGFGITREELVYHWWIKK